jgi:hypothetical protein
MAGIVFVNKRFAADDAERVAYVFQAAFAILAQLLIIYAIVFSAETAQVGKDNFKKGVFY